jgi:hypothetical protein
MPPVRKEDADPEGNRLGDKSMHKGKRSAAIDGRIAGKKIPRERNVQW